MKILMITPYVPYPPASGGQIRTLNLLKHLHKHHYVALIALSKNDKDLEYIPKLKEFCDEVYICKRPEKPWQVKNILKWLVSTKPFLVVRNYSSDARKTIEELLAYETFDVIHCETFYVMPHIPEKTSTPTLLVDQTIELEVYKHFVDAQPWFMRPFLNIDIAKLRYWEPEYWKRASLVATVSQQDKQAVKTIAPSIKPVVIPNGAGEDMIIDSLPQKGADGQTLLFQGNFSWLQNVEAAHYLIENIVPPLVKKHPHVKLLIAGQRASIIKSHKHVEVIEIANEDIELVKKLYRTSSIFLAPIFGPGGTRLKILAAMASGLPIVSTSTGIQGLDVFHEKHVLIANDPQEFVRQISRLMEDRMLYQRLRKASFDLIHKTYNWSSISRQLEESYQTLTTS